jgi:signal transduction histidine kinase/DNA-binding response OmpR family regulator/HAMP domain-containing protein
MKISFRILLINFLIVVIILGSSFFIFYTIVYDVLTSLQTRNLRQSANNFMYVYRMLQTEAEDDFFTLYNRSPDNFWKNQKLQTKNINFILEVNDEPDGIISRYLVTHNIYLPEKDFSLREFLNYNPYVIMMYFTDKEGRKYIFGRTISTDMLNEISQRINSDIALVWSGYPADVSNQIVNQRYIYILSLAVENLKSKNNFEIYMQGTESKDILATIYKPAVVTSQDNVYFLIFTTFAEAGELRGTLKKVFFIIAFAGIFLSLIFSYLFTDKIRKQITDLSHATEQTYAGNFSHKIDVKSKDEIGRLGLAFNKMLDELEKKETAKKEYAEFITLINQNPSLKEISDVALRKIVDSGNFLIGGLYIVDDDINLVSSYGLNMNYGNRAESPDFIKKKVLETRETLELFDEDALPVVSAGLVDIKIKYLLLLPIIYNNKPVALLELGALKKPDDEVRDYLEKIKDQLAIGITNARAIAQLENFVNDLKQLNENYHRQNIQIKEQNETLIKLSNELKYQTGELEKQKQKAFELTEAKSKFLANMSHELRTPLNSILGLTELMLEKSDLDRRSKERLEVVMSSGKRLMSLINGLLDLSRIEAGKMDVRYEDVLLDEIIDEVSGAMSPLALEKGIGFKVVKNIDTRAVISTDREKVIQVLINLLGNAVKFTDKGEVLLRVSIWNEMLIFEVSDTGIGIPEGEINLIFEEFRQLSNAKSKRRSGSGLGLAISKKIADILDGNIKVRSELNKGSTFTFSVPFKQIELLMSEPHRNKVNAQMLMKNRKTPVLLIDDNDETRKAIGQYMHSIGYEIIFADNAVAGLQMAEDNQPAAVVLNIFLSGGDGWSLFKELKQNIKTRHIQVIIVSIMADLNLGYSPGIFDYIIKPLSADILMTAFSRIENSSDRKIQSIVIVDDESEFKAYKDEPLFENKKIEFIKEDEFSVIRVLTIQPDLVIVGLVMSEFNGIKISELLHSNAETLHIPVIAAAPADIKADDRNSIAGTLKEFTLKSKKHPIEVLKTVHNRIEMRSEDKYAEAGEYINDEKPEPVQPVFSEADENNGQHLTAEVLIVDDDPNTLFTLAEIVQSCKYNPILANSGKECLEILEHRIPDLILLDIIMPELDGFQTLRQIRRNNKWNDIPIFAVTAKAMKEDKEIILKQGFSDYIPKPVNPAFVSYKIKRLINQLKTT